MQRRTTASPGLPAVPGPAGRFRLATSRRGLAMGVLLLAAVVLAGARPALASETGPDGGVGPDPADEPANATPSLATPDPDLFWHSVDVEPSQFPGAVQDRQLRALWAAGLEAEFADRLAESSEHYVEITRRRPESSMAYWRAARNYWRLGDSMPDERREEKIRWFEEADRWAQRGIEVDPECAACMLFRVGALGRLATTRGIGSSARAWPRRWPS